MSDLAALSPTREFEFTRRDFERVRQLIYAHAGISLSDAKEDLVYSRLARRLRATGIRSFREYLACLENDTDPEWEAFVNALTTNLTSFFREAHHFPILADHLKRIDRPARIWCCAASTGEEPYSIAITAAEAAAPRAPAVRILASDLDTNVLNKAQSGIYDLERVDKMPEERLRRFFLRGSGAREGRVRIKPELGALVEFRRINLLDPVWNLNGPFDAIFCRNVMIYFDKATQRRLLERFHPLLATDGLLFVGHSESLYHVADLFRLRGQTVYQPV